MTRPSAARIRSSTTWAAIDAWSTPGSHSVGWPCMRARRTMRVLDRGGQGVADVERAGHVGRRLDDHERGHRRRATGRRAPSGANTSAASHAARTVALDLGGSVLAVDPGSGCRSWAPGFVARRGSRRRAETPSGSGRAVECSAGRAAEARRRPAGATGPGDTPGMAGASDPARRAARRCRPCRPGASSASWAWCSSWSAWAARFGPGPDGRARSVPASLRPSAGPERVRLRRPVGRRRRPRRQRHRRRVAPSRSTRCWRDSSPSPTCPGCHRRWGRRRARTFDIDDPAFVANDGIRMVSRTWSRSPTAGSPSCSTSGCSSPPRPRRPRTSTPPSPPCRRWPPPASHPCPRRPSSAPIAVCTGWRPRARTARCCSGPTCSGSGRSWPRCLPVAGGRDRAPRGARHGRRGPHRRGRPARARLAAPRASATPAPVAERADAQRARRSWSCSSARATCDRARLRRPTRSDCGPASWRPSCAPTTRAVSGHLQRLRYRGRGRGGHRRLAGDHRCLGPRAHPATWAP